MTVTINDPLVAPSRITAKQVRAWSRLRLMQPYVFRLSHHRKIRPIIVPTILVNVVNDFVFAEVSTQHLLGNETVFGDVPLSIRERVIRSKKINISTGNIPSFSIGFRCPDFEFPPTTAGAKPRVFAIRRTKERRSTLHACFLNFRGCWLRTVWRCRQRSAGLRTESRSLLARKKYLPASFAVECSPLHCLVFAPRFCAETSTKPLITTWFDEERCGAPFAVSADWGRLWGHFANLLTGWLRCLMPGTGPSVARLFAV